MKTRWLGEKVKPSLLTKRKKAKRRATKKSRKANRIR